MIFFAYALFIFLWWSHAVLSVIFGILGSSGIDIGDPTFFTEKKNRKFLIEKKNRIFFDQHFSIVYRIFCCWKSQWKFKILKFRFFRKNTKSFLDFFRRKIFRPENFGSPIPIPNFSKIPKIILRTPCDDSKQVENLKPFC